MKQYAAIFDVDGVLVDSYEAHLRSWQAMASETGVQFTPEQFAATFGQTSRDIIATFWNDKDLTPQRIAELDARKEWLYRQIVAVNFPAMPGATHLIQSLHGEGFRIALGSSGPEENIALAIDHLGIGAWVSAVVTGKDVPRGKPDPEVFVRCAEKLDASPDRCTVIEDAPAGIAAARNAGMTCIAILSQGRKANDFDRTPPDRMVRMLADITPEILRELIDGRATRHDRHEP